MKHLLTLVLTYFVFMQLVSAEEPVRERIEWIDIWVTDADKDDLPRVLLVGDSITRGYFSAVEKHLAGRAYCARLTTSKCVSDPTFNDDLKLILEQYDFSVIHFNNGLHGWGYTEDEYRDGLLKTIAAVKKYAGDAKLVWATTTPVREQGNLEAVAERTKRVKLRNKFASEITTEQSIPTDDLFGLVQQHPEWQSTDGVHFNAQGNEELAKQVAESVLEYLPSAASANK
jgi:hypothetical protein